MIQRERLSDRFLDLLRIDSHSRDEAEIAEQLARRCAALGADVMMDDAGPAVGGNAGNLIARVRGTVRDAPTVMLSAHMDTVTPGKGVKPVVRGDVVRSDGTTVLGGDDKAGCAIILEAVEVLQERRIPHGDIEIVFTVCEEVGLLGAKHLDCGSLAARQGLVFDSDGTGLVFTRQPACTHLTLTVHGVEAHAGVAPEEGISAIQVAAEGIGAMRLGRVDGATTANIACIRGGSAMNVVPNLVELEGEARSFDERQLESQCRHMVDCLERAAARREVTVDGRPHRARVSARMERQYPAMDVPERAGILTLVFEAARRLGRTLGTASSCGSSDANIFNHRGIQCVDLSTGMRAIHTVHEWIDLRDMVATAELTVETLATSARGGREG